MKKFLLTIIWLLFSCFAAETIASSDQLPLMPYPQSLQQNLGGYPLTKNILLNIRGMSERRQQFFQQRLKKQLDKAGYRLNLPPISQKITEYHSINIVVNQGEQVEFLLPSLNQSESYQLVIRDKVIDIVAENDFGAIQGMASLLQLLLAPNAVAQKTLPQVSINDYPRFPWRGLMIDSVRHYISINAIKRQLDGMAAAKLNVFHWHLTDDQGWRFESKSYPKLHQLAADGQYYTQQEIKEIVDYASLLGIRVVPEFDVPGHASAIAVAYPELITTQKMASEQYQMEDHWGVFEPLLDPSNPDVYLFIEKIVSEFSEVFPDQYFHIGGDEVNPKQWEGSVKVQQFMQENNLKDSQALHVFFNQQVQQILAKHQKKMMGWDEIYHPDLPKNIMVQSWRGMDSLSQIAANDYQGILSTGFYIDQPQASAYHYQNEPILYQATSPVVLTEEDKVTAWQFSMPRLKGSAVEGTLVLVNRHNYLIHAYVKFNNNYYKKVKLDRQLTFNQEQINFLINTWMGPTRGEFNLAEPTALSGRMLIGNTHYDVSGQQKEMFDYSSVQLAPHLSTEQEKNILGGEATLWTEMVTEKNIDRRIWPRLFAIAERFWSAKSITNIDSMYQRLLQINDYAEIIGLQHKSQQLLGVKGLVFPHTDITPLNILAQQLEPAHYYTRHHLNYQRDLYHQNAPLNRFVDYLPVESLTLVKLQQQLSLFKNGDNSGLQAIVNKMRAWHYHYESALAISKKNPKLSDLVVIIDDARKINTIGLTIAQSCLAGVKIRRAETKRIQNTLAQIHSNVRDISISSGLFVEKLLEVCRKQ
ncbi:family 20 glycosylhydrolase [Colwelliaceae bacterium 6441]